MTSIEIEKRIENLEAEVALLKIRAGQKGSTDEPWYRQIPTFGGNPAYEEASRLGREYRESQNRSEDDK